jgi:DNA-directed RNA polymerase specialized sigma subunit
LSSSRGLDQELVLRALEVALARLLTSLSAQEAQIVLLRVNGDLSQDAIGHGLGVSPVYVSHALRRSIARFRDAAE